MGEPPELILATLEPAEVEAAANRYGLRSALGGGLTANHHAPLAAFILTMAFAAILALFGFISRRAGELVIILAALLFMIQRLVAHRRIWSARKTSRAEIGRLMSGPVETTIDADGVVQTSRAAVRKIAFVDCKEAEEAGGLIYLWSAEDAPVVIPTRVLADGDAARLLSSLQMRIGRSPASRST
jgi:hypothetical protein